MSSHQSPPPAPSGIPSGRPTVHVRVSKPLSQQSSSNSDTPANAGTKPKNEYTIPEPAKVPRSLRGPAWVAAGKPQQRGIRRLLWLIYASCGLYKFRWIPQPRAISSYPKAITEAKTYISKMRYASMAIAAVITTKGGATKTTVATWFAATLMSIIKFQVAVFDADVGGGKVAKRYALDPAKIMSGIDAVRMITAQPNGNQWLPRYRDIVTHTLSDWETGVMVFHAPAGSVISTDEIDITLGVLGEEFHTLVVDSGPGLKVPITDGLVKRSTVRLIVADINSDDDLDDIKNTLDHPEYKLRENLDSVVIVISAVKWLKYNTRTQYEFAEFYGVKPEQVVLVPFNRYLARNGMSQVATEKALQSKRVTLSALNPKTEYAWCLVTKAVVNAAATYNKSHHRPELPGENTTPTTPPQAHVGNGGTNIVTPTGVTYTPQGVG